MKLKPKDWFWSLRIMKFISEFHWRCLLIFQASIVNPFEFLLDPTLAVLLENRINDKRLVCKMKDLLETHAWPNDINSKFNFIKANSINFQQDIIFSQFFYLLCLDFIIESHFKSGFNLKRELHQRYAWSLEMPKRNHQK